MMSQASSNTSWWLKLNFAWGPCRQYMIKQTRRLLISWVCTCFKCILMRTRIKESNQGKGLSLQPWQSQEASQPLTKKKPCQCCFKAWGARLCWAPSDMGAWSILHDKHDSSAHSILHALRVAVDKRCHSADELASMLEIRWQVT